MAIEVYKSVNNLNPVYLNDMFELTNTGYNLRDHLRLKQEKFDTKKFGYKSLKYYGSKLWNAIPIEIKSAKSVNVFKIKISEWCRSDKAEELIIM